MVVFSKTFERPLNLMTCTDITHSAPGQSCVESLLWTLYRNHVSGGKYYLPLLIAPCLLKYRQLNRKMFLKIFRNYAQTTSFGACMNGFTFFFICIARRWNERLIWYMAPGVPTWFSAQLTAILMPRHILDFFVTGVSHSTMESLLRRFDNILTRKLRNSSYIQTLVFMISSAIILQYKFSGNFNGFWFIEAANRSANLNSLVIDLKKYVYIGLALDTLNALLKGQKTLTKDVDGDGYTRNVNDLIQKILKKLQGFRLKSTSFLLSYLSIYRILYLVLTKRKGIISSSSANLIAAFVSGGAFSLLKEISFMTFGTIIATQVVWQQFCRKNSTNYFANQLKRLPCARLILPLEVAYLVHSFFFHHDTINGLAKGFVNATCDNNKLLTFHGSTQRIYDLLIKNDTETILSEVQKRGRRGFFN